MSNLRTFPFRPNAPLHSPPLDDDDDVGVLGKACDLVSSYRVRGWTENPMSYDLFPKDKLITRVIEMTLVPQE